MSFHIIGIMIFRCSNSISSVFSEVIWYTRFASFLNGTQHISRLLSPKCIESHLLSPKVFNMKATFQQTKKDNTKKKLSVYCKIGESRHKVFYTLSYTVSFFRLPRSIFRFSSFSWWLMLDPILLCGIFIVITVQEPNVYYFEHFSRCHVAFHKLSMMSSCFFGDLNRVLLKKPILMRSFGGEFLAWVWTILRLP